MHLGPSVEGVAPTSRAAHNLAEAGVMSWTLQHHLAQIFTNDRDKLVQALSYDVSHKSALPPEQAISGAPKVGPAPSV
jgi:hypothetical protein